MCGYLGAHYAQAETRVITAMEQYGRQLGLAFQIADDVLDLVGNERKTGKSLGSDLQKQKLTLPLIRLLATATEADACAIRQLLLHPDETTRDQLQPFLDRSDAMKYAHQRALQLAQDARQQLDVVPPSRSRRILAEIAEFAVQRTF